MEVTTPMIVSRSIGQAEDIGPTNSQKQQVRRVQTTSFHFELLLLYTKFIYMRERERERERERKKTK